MENPGAEIQQNVSMFREEYMGGEKNPMVLLVEGIQSEITARELKEVGKTITGEKKGAHPELLLREASERIKKAEEKSLEMQESVDRVRREAKSVGETGSQLTLMGEGLPEKGLALLAVAGSLVDESARLEKGASDLLKMIQQEKDLLVDAASDPKRDPKTGMATGGGLVDAYALRLKKIHDIKDDQERQDKLKDIIFIVKDMMLFHRGVMELGDGFDARLKNYMAAGLISMAEFVALDNTGLYWRMSLEDAETDEGIKKYFPEGSEIRQKLDEMRRLGIVIEPSRLNPGGGDEFIDPIICNVTRKEIVERIKSERGENVAINQDYVTMLMEVERNKRKAIAIEVNSHVTNSTTFSKDRPVINGGPEKVYSDVEIAQRRRVYQLFYDNLNVLVPGEDKEVGVTKEMSSFFYDFKNALRLYFVDSEDKYLTQGFGLLQSDVDLRMDYASVGNAFTFPDLSEIEKFALTSEEFAEGGSKRDKYLTELKAKLARKLSDEDMSDSRVLKDKVVLEVYKDMLSRYQDYLFGLVNGEAKNIKKVNVLANACRGNSQAIFTVGSVKESGRDFGELDSQSRWRLWSNLVSYWIGSYQMEVQKKDDGEKYNTEMVNGRFGKFLVKAKEYLSELSTETGRKRWDEWIDLVPNDLTQ